MATIMATNENIWTKVPVEEVIHGICHEYKMMNDKNYYIGKHSDMFPVMGKAIEDRTSLMISYAEAFEWHFSKMPKWMGRAEYIGKHVSNVNYMLACSLLS